MYFRSLLWWYVWTNTTFPKEKVRMHFIIKVNGCNSAFRFVLSTAFSHLQVCPLADCCPVDPIFHRERLTAKQHVQQEWLLSVWEWISGIPLLLVSCLGGVGWAWPPRGLPQFHGVLGLGFHTFGHSLHPAVHHSHPPISLHPLLTRVQAQEPAERSLFQQPVGWCKENSGNHLGWTWSYMARCVMRAWALWSINCITSFSSTVM